MGSFLTSAWSHLWSLQNTDWVSTLQGTDSMTFSVTIFQVGKLRPLVSHAMRMPPGSGDMTFRTEWCRRYSWTYIASTHREIKMAASPIRAWQWVISWWPSHGNEKKSGLYPGSHSPHLGLPQKGEHPETTNWSRFWSSSKCFKRLLEMGGKLWAHTCGQAKLRLRRRGAGRIPSSIPLSFILETGPLAEL